MVANALVFCGFLGFLMELIPMWRKNSGPALTICYPCRANLALSLPFNVQQTGVNIMGSSLKSAAFLIESRLIDAAKGNPDAYYELGVAFSTGTGGVDVDLIQAHKWFNLAALGGNRDGQVCRAEISDEMSREDIAEAQKQARAWLNAMADAPTAQRFAA